jgi:hypothetical protein
MGPLSFMRSVVDRNVVMRRIPIHSIKTCNLYGTVYKARCISETGIGYLLQMIDKYPRSIDPFCARILSSYYLYTMKYITTGCT